MKKLLPISLILAAALIVSCKNQPVDQIKITGTIKNADTLVLKLVEGQKVDTIKKAADGTFDYQKVSAKPVSGYLSIGKKYVMIYLIPGKDLNLSVDMNNWDSTMVFGGKLKPVADYLADKRKVMSKWSKNTLAYYSKEPAAFRISRDSLEKVYADLITKYEGMKAFEEQYAAKEKLTARFEKIVDLQNFQMMSKYYTKKDTVILPAGWNDFEKGLKLDDPALLQINAAMQYLSGYIGETAQKDAGLTGDVWGKPEFLVAKFATIKKTFSSPEMVETFLYNNLGQQIDGATPKGIDAQLTEYFALAKNQEQIAEIKKKVADWASIMPGMPAPEFTVVDLAGKEFSLSQFKGKYVFIDFWATWCGPCKQEIPFLKKLYEDFEKKNIVIMSISIDQDKKAWEKMVTAEGFKWYQFHDGNKMSDKFVVRYIPSFILIDKEGKIIDPRAPNPSNPDLRKVLDGLAGI
jgi:thiol-disulfide isomerase/thioredoxin